jgi:hypothetical protein
MISVTDPYGRILGLVKSNGNNKEKINALIMRARFNWSRRLFYSLHTQVLAQVSLIR